jgi:hypothetical protein
MGFDVQGVRFLLWAHRHGAQFKRAALIGRQELFIDPGSLARILRCYDLEKSEAEVRGLLTEANGFAEPLLTLLGAQDIKSVDASGYEGASMVHDMNLTIPDGLQGRFSAVIDAGTLEHIFNFPRAIQNCMEMVEVGGHLLLMTPANNFMGHGFYQFSPELFFRVCSDAQGFEVVKIILCEVDPRGTWYEVVDPAKAGRRVEMVNSKPAYLMVLARRVRQVPILAVPPQQSDYTVLWQETMAKAGMSSAAARPLYLRLVRALSRRMTQAYRLVEPSGVAARRMRPDPHVFLEMDWCAKPSSPPQSTDRR